MSHTIESGFLRSNHFSNHFYLMKSLHCVSFALVIVGALNWGLVAVGAYMGVNLNIVSLLLGTWPVAEGVVYLLVGIAAVIVLFTHKRDCRACAVPVV